MDLPRPVLRDADPPKVAIVGAGLAGATCARLLADAGAAVRVFDKSRGVGGRMATRRVGIPAADGGTRTVRFDHGAPAFAARSAAFARLAERAGRDGLLARWNPVLAPGSRTHEGDPALWVPTPDMPALCRSLLADLPVTPLAAIDALRRTPAGWCLEAGGSTLAEGFDAVLLAIPPRQAAPLLRPHRDDWAGRLQSRAMRAGWVLMAATDAPEPGPAWDLALPATGPVERILRVDARPGRERTPDVALWVVHATAAWSEARLEEPAETVQAALQRALADRLGRTPAWLHAAAHRWRYATAVPDPTVPGPCAWDATLGLGACGDAFAALSADGSDGVEAAWRSACALAAAVAGPAVAADAVVPHPPVPPAAAPRAAAHDAASRETASHGAASRDAASWDAAPHAAASRAPDARRHAEPAGPRP